jgi:hypothetical protein
MHDDVTTILAAASRALGTTVTDPVDLGGSARTSVLRCHTGDGTVIVKAHREHTPYFANEAAGLAFTTHGPQLLAVDPDTPLIVMTDLGTAPSLADVLLGTSADDATAALLAWARGYGRIAAETFGKQAEFADLRGRWHQGERPPLTLDTGTFTAALAALDVQPPDGLGADLAEIAALDGPDVFSPGDICPDNNILTDAGLRVLDFEGAGFGPVYLDAAYTRMPFATCWCVYRLPEGLRERIEAAYRAEVVTACPELADEPRWRHGLLLATAWWTVDIVNHLGATSAVREGSIHPASAGAPTIRQVLRYRWEYLAAELDAANVLPALAGTVRRLLAATDRWPTTPLPLYPALGNPSPPTIVTS